ncbi:malate synthase G [Halarcobacter anaerophilus]|uniref:Malate synthase G n=1 Tax=Halarcobacter anaerophilus TaxID=877500 RepID=A0A4Q0Y3W4_9BACT|nr:malate synthase G [Halarcobacter anaerophilus]QDF27538.1 malate synthase G [Halarcobacter anaerophilus]RXJ63894.1 malate synthase G [Halarcobacter anaerophilus]
MRNKILNGNLKIDESLYNLINEEILPTTQIKKEDFWSSFEKIIEELTPTNKALLEKREELQNAIDNWHKRNRYSIENLIEYKNFLKEIGYLQEPCEDFKVTTQNVDEEIALQAGPQLVVPVKNARFALNAANARWGSLYDALYGSDIFSKEGELAITKEYNKKRGEKVVNFAKEHLDCLAPLTEGSHKDAIAYKIVDNKLQVELKNKELVSLKEKNKALAFAGEKENPTSLVLKNNNLHVIIEFDKNSFIGKLDLAGIKDVTVEAAVTTIMDCEDSIAAVDAQDKVEVYRNWFGLMKGTLEESFIKNGKSLTRKLNKDKVFKTLDNKELILHGRSLLFIRNVGHLMTNPAILDKNDEEIFEGIMDCMITTLAAIPDLTNKNQKRNSRTKSLYIVKPKMHGPQEVAFAVRMFALVEKALNLPLNTLKIGIMDEERRTSVNLKECIKEAKDRVVFINTGFLDRTGDEIHTSMLAGAMTAKTKMKQEPWIKAYENWNVDIGLECGLQGKAQIGKGMWAMPDEMAKMMTEKISHPKSGANTAWVPSPTAAVLHSIHYHQVDVFEVQNDLKGKRRASLEELLTIPLLKEELSKEQIKNELDNNAQGILGYVVRWIDEGIGCSKVPDINNIALMEDRATLRISSQHLANWLEHGICTKEEVMNSLEQMAKVVDKQNEKDPNYIPIAPAYDGFAFKAACDLIFKGKTQPSGYTEPILHQYRREFKDSICK